MRSFIVFCLSESCLSHLPTDWPDFIAIFPRPRGTPLNPFKVPPVSPPNVNRLLLDRSRDEGPPPQHRLGHVYAQLSPLDMRKRFTLLM